jgi:hypothetical protein
MSSSSSSSSTLGFTAAVVTATVVGAGGMWWYQQWRRDLKFAIPNGLQVTPYSKELALVVALALQGTHMVTNQTLDSRCLTL